MPFYFLANTALVDASNDWSAPNFIGNNISVVIKVQKNQADKHPYILRHYVLMVSQKGCKGNNFQAFFVGLNKKIYAAKFNRLRFLGFAAPFACVSGIFTFLCIQYPRPSCTRNSLPLFFKATSFLPAGTGIPPSCRFHKYALAFCRCGGAAASPLEDFSPCKNPANGFLRLPGAVSTIRCCGAKQKGLLSSAQILCAIYRAACSSTVMQTISVLPWVRSRYPQVPVPPLTMAVQPAPTCFLP